jgi:uncharacterized protein (TIGR03435 family)
MALQTANDGVVLQLNGGTIIVTAAKQGNGHLYVRTKDVTVSVIGTVFLVNAEEEGSQVAVIQGEIQAQQGKKSEKLHPGEQITTNPSMRTAPLSEELAWSQNATAYVALLQKATAVPNTPLRFEAVSIKLPVYPRSARFGCRGADGTVDVRGFGSAFADAFFRTQVLEGPLQVARGRCIGQPDLPTLIAIAYGIQHADVSGGPDWQPDPPAKVVRYSIEAKAEDDSGVTKDQLRQMLQSMLADRFNLKVHWDTREVLGSALVVAKNGPKLKETTDEEVNPHPVMGSTSILDAELGGKSTMQALADGLRFFQGNTPTVDKTNLHGVYDYTLKLRFAGPGERGGGGSGGDGFDPPLSTALQQQLGLRLEPAKIQVRTLVIDHLEKPTEN